MTEIYRLAENVYRVISWEYRKLRGSLLTKYGLIDTAFDGEPELIYAGEEDSAVFENGYTLAFSLKAYLDGGFDIRLPLDEKDRLFGLGDATRNSIQHRGKSVLMLQKDPTAYGPIPYLMSSRGWAIMLNCTYAHTFDMGASDPDMLHISAGRGVLDMIVICGKDMREALFLQGKIAGRPVMLPKMSYGLTVVHNEQADAHSLINDAVRYKERNIPCDMFGLEPSWMEKFYDESIEKKWDYKRFPIWYWMGDHAYGCNFVEALNNMGYGLSLWLCCSYDLFWKEENDMVPDEQNTNRDDLVIQDANLMQGYVMDKVTKRDEPWFEHLKKFVDNGAESFKLDGAWQVVPFPDRVWANRYTDDEIRNLYPVVYARQMKEGYEEYCGRRAMIYTPGAYLGIQKYASTWAGDTGGSLNVLVSLMNYAMCGHSNASFDMYVKNKVTCHAGFLAPWTQHQNWSTWDYPWCFKTPGLEESYRWYSQLRSSLFPYIYAYAHVANETSISLMRPLSLMYPENARYDGVKNEYMFGESLLVSAWDNNVVLPEEDEWFDFFTGKKWEGEKEFRYTPSELHGGGLFVKAGSIVVMQDWAHSLREYRPDKLYLHVYPGKDAEFTLYEDDYYTYAYEKGEIAKTKITLSGNVLTIHPREGSYTSHHDPARGHASPTGDTTMPAPVDFEIIWHHDDGTSTNYTVCAAEYEKDAAVITEK